ncbi:MAG: hypothetical protein V4702_02825 [Patescibacteria group bacterium]
MKRLLVTLVTLFSLIGLSSTSFAATRYWKVNISSPANTTSKSFNVQYQTFSTIESDDITVELFQNGSSVGSQTTTTSFGDSGAFPVTVATVGTYSYFVKATNLGDSSVKNTGTVSVTVSEPPAGTVTTNTVVVNNGTNTATTDPAVGGQGGGGAVAQGGAAGGQAGAPAAGQTGDQPATTTTPNDDGSVLGSETKKDDTANNAAASANKATTNPLWYVLGLGALSAVAYGAYTMRARGSKE